MEIEFIKKEIIKHIKNKKELSSIDDNFVIDFLNKYLQKNNLDLSYFIEYKNVKQLEKSKKYKSLISEIRSELRKIYGVFIKNNSSNFKTIINNLKSYDDEIIDEILNSHQSSNERLNYYPQLYSDLFDILFSLDCKQDFVILDFACGFNPFSYKYFPEKPKKYFASDLSSNDMFIINNFFKKTNISGIAIKTNLLDETEIDFLLNTINQDLIFKKEKNISSICFLFKALDSLESIIRHSSKKLFSKINANYFVVSFPKKTLGGNKIIPDNKRNWFEKFIQKMNLEYKTHEIDNEFFYIIKKS